MVGAVETTTGLTPAQRFWRPLLGILALESAVATLILIAGNPPSGPRATVIHLPPAPLVAKRAFMPPPSELAALVAKHPLPAPLTPLQIFARLKPLVEPATAVVSVDRIGPTPFTPRRDPLHPPARLPDVLPIDRPTAAPRPRETEAGWLLAARDRLDPAPPGVGLRPETAATETGGWIDPDRVMAQDLAEAAPLLLAQRADPLPAVAGTALDDLLPAVAAPPPETLQALTDLIALRDDLHGGPPAVDPIGRTQALLADALVSGGYRDQDLAGFRGVAMFDYAHGQRQQRAARRDKPAPHFGLTPYSGAFTVSAVSPPKPELLTRTAVPSTEKLLSLFDAHDYDTAQEAEVPGVFLARLPHDLPHAVDAQERKGIFVRSVLPHLLHVNEHLLETRQRILKIAGRVETGDLTEDDRAFVTAVLTEFRLDRWSLPELLKRVDIVPPSLALAQAAEESGWGTSNLARDGNALFGMVMWVRDAEGRQVRRQRPYADLAEGVASYVRNLNTHFAYAGFRDQRARLRLSGRPISGPALMAALGRYSERGQDYVRSVNGLLAYNNLDKLDSARLRGPAPDPALSP